MNQSVILILVTAVISFVFGIFAGPLLSPSEINNGIETETLAEAKSKYYTCPMHTHIHQEHEGDCPICGMSLVSKQLDDLPASNDSDKSVS